MTSCSHQKAHASAACIAIVLLAMQAVPRMAGQGAAAAAAEQRALAARARGDNDAALRILLQGSQAAPDDARLLYDLGVQEDAMHLYWDAYAAVTRLRALPGGDTPQVLYLAARVKMDLGQLAPAAELMRIYLQARPDDASAHFGFGRMLQLEEKFDAAKEQFAISLRLAPHQTESQFELGEIALAQGQYAEAQRDYAETLAGNPKHAGALAGTGIACFHLHQYAQAEASLRQAIADDPNYQPAHYYLGLTLAREGHPDAAKKELAAAAAMEQQQQQAAAARLHLATQPGTETQP